VYCPVEVCYKKSDNSLMSVFECKLMFQFTRDGVTFLLKYIKYINVKL